MWEATRWIFLFGVLILRISYCFLAVDLILLMNVMSLLIFYHYQYFCVVNFWRQLFRFSMVAGSVFY